MKRIQQGFTLIELMIVVAIIGILAAIAVPAYQDYVTRAKFATMITAIDSLKLAISECLQNNAGAAGSCNTSAQLGGITFPTAATMKYSGAVTVDATAGINFTGTAVVNSATFILTPTLPANASVVTWTQTGTCASATPKLC